MVNVLRSHDIHVMVIEDTQEPIKPDAIFPNNWISTHQWNHHHISHVGKQQKDRKKKILLKRLAKYKVNNRYSFEFYEEEDEPLFFRRYRKYDFDHIHKIVYACSSPERMQGCWISLVSLWEWII